MAVNVTDEFERQRAHLRSVASRSPEAARQLASRARRRVGGAAPDPDADLAEQRRVVDAFLAAARGGDFEALLEVLDPDVVFRADRGALALRAPAVVRGAEDVAREILSRGAGFAPHARPAIVNGAAGLAVRIGGKPVAVIGFSIASG